MARTVARSNHAISCFSSRHFSLIALAKTTVPTFGDGGHGGKEPKACKLETVPCRAAWPAKINVYLVRHSERADEVKDVSALQNASQI